MNFDYRIIGQRPNVGNSFDFAGGAKRAQDERRMNEFKGLVSNQLAGGSPDMASILGGMANIDPMKALQMQQMQNKVGMPRETDSQRRMKRIEGASGLLEEVANLESEIISKSADPNYNLSDDFIKLKALETKYFNKVGKYPKTNPFQIEDFRSKRKAQELAEKKQEQSAEAHQFQKDKYYTSRQDALEKEARGDEKEIAKLAGKMTPIFGSFYQLRANPNDVPAKADALLTLLRKESGAAIGQSELIERLQTVLPTKDYNSLLNEAGGFQGWIEGALKNENQGMIRRIQKYMPRMMNDRILNVLKNQIGGEDVFQYLEKTYKPYSEESTPSEKAKPKNTRREATLEDF
jgi:hypothetical protein